ncbi:hypothetical protein ETB97_003545 [Aspergillus alliaceus]|uniref:alpha-L-rhamnosidase n=1 Tax=Petromyces alliaceus TaxID=209559 RepID=A0A8H6A132_PETAA|nr:hypothetical protein ETB97_003545 [Aspergillus burnettii]
MNGSLIDVEHDQKVLGGVPAMVMVTPNATLPDPTCSIGAVRRDGRQEHFSSVVYEHDYLDEDIATKSNRCYTLVGYQDLPAWIGSTQQLRPTESHSARKEIHDQYVIPNGRITSDAQAAYALAICFDLLTPVQRVRAGNRLVELVRKNEFDIGTGFAGTPYLCEALALTGHVQVAYSMLLGKNCPAWLYPVMMGATPVWERWDSILPDGSINPGEMTPFNHYAFGAIAKFLLERVAGLQRL